MPEVTREHILAEIKRTAESNKPLGHRRFEKETGINPYEWQKYWARFGDAQREAGFTSNVKQIAYEDSLLLEKLIEYMRQLGKFPTWRELRVNSYSDAEFPSMDAFKRRGSKEFWLKKLTGYCSNKVGYDDVLKLCSEVPIEEETDLVDNAKESQIEFGFVYLIKSGRYYKIGKANDVGLRKYQLKIQLPDKAALIHEIKTDDPHGIERYWHQRFDSKRKNGEWFELGASDISAFKRRKGFM